MKCRDKSYVVDVLKVNLESDLIIMTKNAQTLRCVVKDINVTSRNVLGVRIFNIAADDMIASVEIVQTDN
jgi:DNA gyrase/topoisomerase IV subunit A